MQSATVPVVLLLLVMALLAGGAAWRESVTVDEIAHTGAGVSYLQKLDMRMNEEHPPLAKMLAALPLVLRRARADYSDASWTFSGERMFNEYMGEWVFGHWFLMRWNDPVSTLRWARAPMLLLMLVLGFALYKCGARLGGSQWGGLLCLTAIRDHARLPGIRAAGDHRHYGDVVLDFGDLATAADVEISQQKASTLPGIRHGGSFSLEIFVGAAVLRVSGSRGEHEILAAAGTAN